MPESATIRATDVSGLLYGTQTLRQLLPVEAENRNAVGGVAWTIPEVTIEDEPRYGWRGMHLDVGRHFYPASFIRKFLDTMALHKFNVLHWHLTEDQGWRIEIQRYSELIEVGAWRDASPYPADRHTLDGVAHGGFYTQQEVKDIVAYAQSLGITIVPEIETTYSARATRRSTPFWKMCWMKCWRCFRASTFISAVTNAPKCAGKNALNVRRSSSVKGWPMNTNCRAISSGTLRSISTNTVAV
jgi:hexosaminidase